MRPQAIQFLSLPSRRGRCFVPTVALDAGLADRYRYWRGRSGQPYLFTRVDWRSAREFRDALVLVVEGGRILWAGEADELREAAASVRKGIAACYVHLLSAERAARRAVAHDLAGDAGERVDLDSLAPFRSAA